MHHGFHEFFLGRFVVIVGLVVIVVIMLHAHHFGEFLKGKRTVVVFVKCAHNEFARWHAHVIIFHGINVLNEVFQFLEGEAAAVVSV